jgi:hypothetical protein
MPAAPPVLDLRLTLRDVNRPVWRTLRVSSGATLSRVQRLICVCFGWPGGRSHAFEARHLRYASQGRGADLVDVRLRQVLHDAGSELEFEYGERFPWYVQALVEKVFAPSDAIVTPRCVGAEGVAPPLNAGGAESWNEREYDGLEDAIHGVVLTPERGATRVAIRVDAINAELVRLR